MTKRAFTLIELMVTMAIIAVLAILIIGSINIARGAQALTQNRANARAIEAALEGYISTNANKYCKSGIDAAWVECANPVDPNIYKTFNYYAPTLVNLGYKVNLQGACASSTGGGLIRIEPTKFTILVADKNCNTAIDITKYIDKIVH